MGDHSPYAASPTTYNSLWPHTPAAFPRDWLVTVLRPAGLVYFLCMAPREDYNNLSEAFTNFLDGVRFKP